VQGRHGRVGLWDSKRRWCVLLLSLWCCCKDGAGRVGVGVGLVGGRNRVRWWEGGLRGWGRKC
jgi:hypothetical protein